VDAKATALVEQHIGALERTGRVVTPTFGDWKGAGKMIAQVMRAEPSLKSKAPQLLNDILIALCARRIGATVFTYNGDDFRVVRRYRTFALEVLQHSQS
jgi:predicted nucleic acid-binding protein